MTTTRTVPQILEEGAATFRERNAVYRDNYKAIGPVMLAAFNGVIPAVANADDANRLMLILSCMTKLTRYAAAFSEGGHAESARDLCVYAAMLEELTQPKVHSFAQSMREVKSK